MSLLLIGFYCSEQCYITGPAKGQVNTKMQASEHHEEFANIDVHVSTDVASAAPEPIVYRKHAAETPARGTTTTNNDEHNQTKHRSRSTSKVQAVCIYVDYP